MDWPQDWFKEFIELRKKSKTYVNIGDEFIKLERRWWTKIFHRYLFWHTIKRDSLSTEILEILDWLCKDNTKSKWTLSLAYSIPDNLYQSFKTNGILWALRINGPSLVQTITDPRQIIYTFHFKNKDDLLLFKMKW